MATLAAFLPGAALASIADGGFESGVLVDAGPPPLPVSLGQWMRSSSNSRLVSPPFPVHAGQFALEVDTRQASRGSFAYQDFHSGNLSYVWTFWILPDVGLNVAEVVYSWDRSAGSAILSSELLVRPDGLRFRAWGGQAEFAPIPYGAWHEVKVVADRCTSVQDVFVDGTAWGAVQGALSPPQGDATVILGDVPFRGFQARHYYDDVAFALFECEQPPVICPLSHGFWKNHPQAWPVDSIVLGRESYPGLELRALLRMAARGDASVILARQLIAAELNVANGSDSLPLDTAIVDAHRALEGFAGKLPYRVGPSSPEGRAMVSLAQDLDAFNNGMLTPGCSPQEGGVVPELHVPPVARSTAGLSR